MFPAGRLDDYGPLLTIRRSAARRDTFIIGALLAASLLAGIALNSIIESNSRSTFSEMALTIVLALSFSAAWSRFEAVNAVTDLAERLSAPQGVANAEQSKR